MFALKGINYLFLLLHMRIRLRQVCLGPGKYYRPYTGDIYANTFVRRITTGCWVVVLLSARFDYVQE